MITSNNFTLKFFAICNLIVNLAKLVALIALIILIGAIIYKIFLIIILKLEDRNKNKESDIDDTKPVPKLYWWNKDGL